jgi:hypothetical protein
MLIYKNICESEFRNTKKEEIYLRQENYELLDCNTVQSGGRSGFGGKYRLFLKNRKSKISEKKHAAN